MNPQPVEQDICVIIPTIREYECVADYVKNARANDFDTDRLFFLLVTEDFCETAAMGDLLADLDVSGAVFDGTSRAEWFASKDLEAYESLIPEASHAETSFGLLYMWSHPQFETGVFIDDDTRPHDGVDFFGQHLANLSYDGHIDQLQSDTHWVNVLHRTPYESLYPRGYPYAAMGETVDESTTSISSGSVVASQGLWTNVPDLDAVRILMDGDLEGQAQTRIERGDYGDDFVAAPGQYLTVCSMNLAFRRAVIPVFYQLPMDDNPWEVGRFDDIWSGVFLKRACDVLGDTIYNGDPLCAHNKAPRSTFDDLHNEVAGLELNEYLWTVIDDAGADAESYEGVARAIARTLEETDVEQYRNGEFLHVVGERMTEWLDCLTALEREPVPADD